MIKCKGGKLEFKGNAPMLMAEFATIVHAMKFEIIPPMKLGDEPEETLMRLVKEGCKTEEELEELGDPKEMLKDVLSKLLKELEGVKE